MTKPRIICVLTGGTFQHMSAVEAVRTLSAPCDHIILYARERAGECNALTDLPWRKVTIFHPKPQRSRIDRYANLIRFAHGAKRFIAANGSPEILLLGHIGDYFNAIANECSFSRVVVLDEGTGTPAAHRQRLAEITSPDPAIHERLKRRTKNILYAGSTAPLPRIDAFTVFRDLPLTPVDKSIVHGFDLLKTTRNDRPRSYTLVLGTPAVQLKMINPYEYGKMMIAIDERAIHPIVYRPHPGERGGFERYLPEGWSVEHYVQPIESRLLSGDTPKEIYGWASTALISAKLIVGDIATIYDVVPSDRAVNEHWVERLRHARRIVGGFDIESMDMPHKA